jgi:putative transcriptional regulator
MKQLELTIAGEIALSKDPGGSMKKWREIFGINQTQMAEHLKISSSTISDYEGGRRKSPGIQVVSRFVSALMTIDESKGGKIIKQLERDFTPKENVFDIHEFKTGVNGKEFTTKINAECVSCPQKLKDTQIYGYTIIDSLKVIIDVPVHEYMTMYGKTPERALVFTQVETGRSPLIAVKIGRFSTDMKPSIIILHGVKKVDPVAIKIAETEKIPLLLINTSLEELKKNMNRYE